MLAPLAPFERHPHIAVAVSGGADSLALCLLAHDWLRRGRGHATALIVDHRLRPESAAEARRVAGWLAARGIAHEILVWREDAADTGRANLQARARAARYRLLADWCRRHGVLHLLTGHHREDQAETVLIRLARGSGADGLAGMPMIAETAELRVLRPLLGVPRARLAAHLRRRRQAWIEDPSNLDDRFQRVRVRERLGAAADGEARVAGLADTARRLARARAALEGATARLLARAVAVDPAGFATVDRAALAGGDEEIALRGLSRVLMTVGGAEYPPRLERLERLLAAVRGNGLGRGRTLGGCRVAALSGGARLLVCREAAAVAGEAPLRAGRVLLWDGRFRAAHVGGGRPLRLGKLGSERPEAPDAAARRRLAAVPAAVRPSLPALRDQNGLLAIPHIGYLRPGAAAGRLPALRFAPPRPLAAAIFR